MDSVDIEPSVRVLVKTARTIELSVDEKRYALTSRSALPRTFTGNEITVAGRPYRGAIHVLRKPGSNSLLAINELSLELYLMGVVPGEMPASWPAEALKAQAVAARSYALATVLERRRADPDRQYDLHATVADQVYRGKAAETPSTNEAVRLTAGEFLSFSGDPVRTFFHSHCGGHTSRAEAVWGPHSGDDMWRALNDAVYASRSDTWCVYLKEDKWKFTLDDDGLEAVARHLRLRSIEMIEAAERDEAGRITLFRISGRDARSRAVRDIEGNRFRLLVGASRLRSLRADVIAEEGTFVFIGQGWGHGVGLCQWGARGRAEANHSYHRILGNYFPGAWSRSIASLFLPSRNIRAVDENQTHYVPAIRNTTLHEIVFPGAGNDEPAAVVVFPR